MEITMRLYDVIFDTPGSNFNSTELPGWAVPILIVCGVVIVTAVVVKIVKGRK
ncbi:MAG: hypothetical protein NC078_08945 [Ruminococcus sp.]|nr:hypothetical protein [Ruminococcus sp.]